MFESSVMEELAVNGSMRRKRLGFILALVIGLTILTVSSAEAQTSKDGPMAKLTHSLVLLHEQYAARQSQRNSAPFSSNDPLATLVNDSVVVDAWRLET